MPSLAILLQVARAHKPLKWEDKSLDFRDAMVIVDAGNNRLWVCDEKTGQFNRKFVQDWIQLIQAEKITLTALGIPENPKESVNIDENTFRKIIELNHESQGEYLVNITIPLSFD